LITTVRTQIDIHAIITFKPSIQVTVATLAAAAIAGMDKNKIVFFTCTAWYGTEENENNSVVGWRVSTVFDTPGPTLPQQQAAIEAGLTDANLAYEKVSVYFHPLPPKARSVPDTVIVTVTVQDVA